MKCQPYARRSRFQFMMGRGCCKMRICRTPATRTFLEPRNCSPLCWTLPCRSCVRPTHCLDKDRSATNMSDRPPRILYLTSCWPHDHTYGGQLRALHIGRALKEIGEVTLALVSSDIVTEEVVHKTAAEFKLEPAIRVE